jgi:hypothetical protein
MAQFRATISGQRGEASRLGSKNSGMSALVNGWNSGVRVEARHIDGMDCFDVYATGGSHKATHDTFLGTVNAFGVWFPNTRQVAA